MLYPLGYERNSSTVGEDLAGLLPSWRRHLRAEKKSTRTIQSYTEAAEQFQAFLAASGMPTVVTKLTSEHVEAFLEHLLDAGRSASTSTSHGCG